MELKAMFGPRGTFRATFTLTVGYVLAIALFVCASEGDPSFGVVALCFFEALFGAPILIACGLSMWLDSVGARRTLLGFVVFYVLFSVAIFYSTFTGEHDAQYQLLLFQVPIGGFAALLMAATLAGLFGRARRREVV